MYLDSIKNNSQDDSDTEMDDFGNESLSNQNLSDNITLLLLWKIYLMKITKKKKM